MHLMYIFTIIHTTAHKMDHYYYLHIADVGAGGRLKQRDTGLPKAT